MKPLSRIFLLSFFCLCLCAFAGVAGKAEAASDARTVLEGAVNEVLAELKKPALTDPNGRAAVLAEVEKIILRLFDFTEFSMRTVGRNWQSFSDDQKKRFESAFTDLLRETYLEKLNNYNGETVDYLKELPSRDGAREEIQTVIRFKDQPTSVNYKMIKKDRWVVYDVVIEGVSMVQNYRTQFNDLLAKGDAEALIAPVQAKAREMKDFNRKQQMDE